MTKILLKLFEAKPSPNLIDNNLLSYRYSVFLNNNNKFLFSKYNDHIEHARTMSRFLTAENIQHFFPKTLIHDGDIGGDIDLHIIGNPSLLPFIVKNLSLSPDKSSVLNLFASKFAYTNPNNNKIEIHFSLGSFGELNFLKKKMVQSIRMSKSDFPVLNDEYALFFLLIQRGLSHNTIRVTDYLYFKKLYYATNNDKIISEIKKIGLFRIYNVFRYILKLEESDSKRFVDHVLLHGYCYKFSIFEMILNYMYRFYSDLINFRVNGLFRISVSPLIIAATKLFRSS